MAKRIHDDLLTPRDVVESYKAAAADQSHLGRKTAVRLKESLKAKGVKGDACIQELKRFVADRILARVGRSEQADRWMVKGGVLWFLDDASSARPTMDLDLHMHRSAPHAEVLCLLKDAMAMDLGDGAFFDVVRIDTLDHTTAEEIGLRVFVEGYFGGSHTNIHIDVGFGGVKPKEAVERTWTPLVKNLPPAVLTTQPWTHVVADKVSAALQHGVLNTRFKDYRDLWVLSRKGIPIVDLGRAFSDVLPGRGFDLPTGTEPGFSVDYAIAFQADWTAYLDRARLTGKCPADFLEVICGVRAWVAEISAAAPEVASISRFAA